MRIELAFLGASCLQVSNTSLPKQIMSPVDEIRIIVASRLSKVGETLQSIES